MPPGSTDPGNPGTGNGSSVSTEQLAVSLGMSIMSSDAAGVPRLMRSFRPRAGLSGAAPEAAARDHVAALTPLWLRKAPPMALAGTGTQPLRNGATIVKLAQHVNGVLVDRGELRVLMHPDGSLAAVSGSLVAPPASPPQFAAQPGDALDHALDALHGSGRARPAIADVG